MTHSPSASELTARRYFENVSGRDAAALCAMYAPEGWLDLPDGRRIAGREALLNYYLALFQHGGPAPSPTRFVSDAGHCVVELVAALPGGVSHQVLDCFTLEGSGLIASLAVYTRHSSPQKAP